MFVDLPGKKGQGRRGKWRGIEGKFEREEVEKIEHGREKGIKMSRGPFFFCLFVPSWNHWILFGVYQNGHFYQEKSHFKLGHNWENWLCPLWKIFLLRQCFCPAQDQSPLTPCLMYWIRFFTCFWWQVKSGETDTYCYYQSWFLMLV